MQKLSQAIDGSRPNASPYLAANLEKKNNCHVGCSTQSRLLAWFLIVTPTACSGKSWSWYFPSVLSLSDAIKKATCATCTQGRQGTRTPITLVGTGVTSEVVAARATRAERKGACPERSGQHRSFQEQSLQRDRRGKVKSCVQRWEKKKAILRFRDLPQSLGVGC